MTRPIVACLVVTNRPEWMPFCYHQIEKQLGDIDKRVIVIAGEGSIPEKRNEALAKAREQNVDAFAWFDDDDWSNQRRLDSAVRQLSNDFYCGAVGAIKAWFLEPHSGMGCLYQAPEGIVFNGAVFNRRWLKLSFSNALRVGEDTDWLMRWHKMRPDYLVVGTDMHAWLCHQKNVTNRIGTRAFDQQAPAFLSDEEKRLIP